MIRITSLSRPKNRLPPLKKNKSSSRVLPSLPLKKKNVVEPCTISSNRAQILAEDFSPTSFLRRNGFGNFQQNPDQDLDYSDESDSDCRPCTQESATDHFLKREVNFTVLAEGYIPGFAKDKFRSVPLILVLLFSICLPILNSKTDI